MNNHKLRELARQAGFNVDSDGNISLYGGGCKLLLRPNYQATVADGIKLLVDLAIKEERNAWENKLKEQKSKCNPHPKAPHGFNRNASHANDRYTCECEGWDAYDAGYQAGVMAGIEASMGEPKEPEQEPVAHCEAGPEYCWKCNEEMKPTYGSEEIRKLREVNKHLSDHIPDVKKMVEALRKIGDFAHDKSTGPAVPDALWEIRSMAYDAMIEFRLMEGVAHPPVPTAQPDLIKNERDKLRAFAQEIMDGWPDVGMLDGFDLQELAVKHGLLAETTRHKPCVEEGCNCAEMVDEQDWQEGVQCYHSTDLLKGIA